MKEMAQYIALFLAMIIVQVLICNHIAIFNVAIPLIFIYFIIRLPIDISTNLLLSLSFFLGFTVDLFSDTMGVNSLCCTLLAIVKKPLLYAYVPRDDRTKSVVPSISTLGVAPYSKFLLTFVAIYCLLTFSIEYFKFADVKDILIMSAASAIVTFAMLLGFDSLMISRK